mmetsp:Transcript_28448/g.69676  ORF Transcript_28448/g.69676 Transcript_28448/m.69676 type:complete len:283 (-) Transcript_28448:302-1150(-)
MHSHPSSTKHCAEHPSPPSVLPSSQNSLPTTTPSPHSASHGCCSPRGPSHLKPGSMVQSREHPSPFSVLPSSHCSNPLFLPSEHVARHTDGSVAAGGNNPVPALLEQPHPSSCSHSEEQPSPSSWLPSSHPSPSTQMPSPHGSGLHLPPMSLPSASVSQSKPASCTHASVHPSPDARDHAPSSHSSPASATRTPSPHRPEHTSYETSVLFTQYHPTSTAQEALHPSPGNVLLSSHSSGKTRTPSPQSVEQPFSSHLNPVSRRQPLHPSKLASFPSSHSSLPT